MIFLGERRVSIKENKGLHFETRGRRHFRKCNFLKGRLHCFSMQVIVMNKCFLLNPEKYLAQVRLVVFEKNALLIPKNDVTGPKARLL